MPMAESLLACIQMVVCPFNLYTEMLACIQMHTEIKHDKAQIGLRFLKKKYKIEHP